MLSKKEQTRKNKPDDVKKLKEKQFKQYRIWLFSNYPECQAQLDGCQGNAIDAHHVLFGSYGADKDDKAQITICRSCHDWCHKNKALSQELFLHVARSNWKEYGGCEDE